MREKLKEIPVIPFLFIILIPLFVLFIPFIAVVSIFDFFQIKRFKKRYTNYLLSIEGKKFFCYNNRKNNHHYIEKNIIPNLRDIESIFVESKHIRNDHDKQYISYMLSNVSDRKGSPYLIKISNGKALDKSISNEFHNFKSQNKNPEDLLILINNSFNNLKSEI